MKLYTDVLRNGWQFALKHPHLWMLGIFTILVTGVAGEFDRYIRVVLKLNDPISFGSAAFWQETIWGSFVVNTAQALQAGDMQTWVFVALFAASCLLVLYLMAVAQGGLVAATHQYQAKGKRVSLATAVRHGQAHVWQVLVVQLASVLSIFTLTLLVSTFLKSNGWLIVAIVLLLPIVVGISMLSRYTVLYIVTESLHIGTAFMKAAKLLGRSVGVSVEMSLVVFTVAVMINLALVIVSLLLIAPFSAITYSVVESTQRTAAIYNALFVGGFTYIAILLVTASAFATWQWAAWTNLFLRLQNERPKATLIRAFRSK